MSGTQLLPAEQIRLPLLPLRDVVVFPHMVIPLFVGRPKSIKALEAAMEAGKSIMLVAQKTAAKDEPTDKDLYEVGCIANILQMLKLPDGTVKVLVEGTQRANILSVTDDESHFFCEAVPVGPEPTESAETEALRRFRTFDRVSRGEPLGTNRSGPVTCPLDGWVVMPLYQEGQEGYFVVVEG